MHFKAYQSTLSQLSARFHLMVFLVLTLSLANCSLAFFIWQVWHRHSIEITPFFGSNGYLKSETMVDSHYLSLMAENFIYSRLNVTPETVDANHQRLLQFADNQSYSQLLHLLSQEAKVIRAQKMGSVFEIQEIRTNPNTLSAEVSGFLKRTVGFQALKEERLSYQLQFRYRHGHLSILRFLEVKEALHA